MNQPQILDKNQFQRTKNSLTTLAHMVAVSGSQDSQESVEVLKAIEAVKKNQPGAAEKLYDLYGKLQKHLEDIKKFGKKIEYQQVNKLKEVLHLCAINNILSGTTKEKRAVLEKRVKLLLKKLRKGFDEQIKEEKKLLKKKHPEGSVWTHIISGPGTKVDGPILGDKLKTVAQQEEELYNQIIKSLPMPGTMYKFPFNINKEKVSKLLIRYLALLELEFEHLFKIQLDVDVKESHVEKNLETAKNTFDAKARKIVNQLEKNYFAQISNDVMTDEKLAKASKKLIKEVGRKLTSTVVEIIESKIEQRKREKFIKNPEKYIAQFDEKLVRAFLEILKDKEPILKGRNIKTVHLTEVLSPVSEGPGRRIHIVSITEGPRKHKIGEYFGTRDVPDGQVFVTINNMMSLQGGMYLFHLKKNADGSLTYLKDETIARS